MNRAFFLKNFLLPAAFFSLVINMLMLAPTYYMLQLFDRVLATRSEEALWLLSLLLLLALIVLGAMEVVRSRILVNANNTIDAILAPYVLRKTLEGAVEPEGNRYQYALRDLHTVRTFVTGMSFIQILDAPWLPVYMILLWFMNPALFWVLVVGTILMIAMTASTEYLTKRPLGEANAASREASRFVDSSMKNAEALNAMGMQDAMIRRWALLNDKVMVLQSRASNRAGSINGVTKFIRQFITALSMAAGTYIILKDPTFTPGLMIVGGLIFGKALMPLEYVINGWKTLSDTRDAYLRLEAFFKSVSQELPCVMELPPPTGQITLEHITFGIRATSKIMLRDVSFSLEAGEFLGVVGPSASGKSTLARLLVNVWKPVQGVIRMDGSDIKDWPPDRLGRYIGYLPQDIELFAGTIAENIARLEEPDSEKVLDAAKLAGLHEIILHMPNGYDTEIGEGGATLSGGQRQRVGLARAVYGNPKFLVLDEPNASLDSAGEVALVNALLKLKQSGRTTVLITHNPNFLMHVDKLLVMQNGEAVAFGPKDLVMSQALTQSQAAQQIKQQPQQRVTA